MKQLARIFTEPSFHILLLIGSLVSFCWPFMTLAPGSVRQTFFHLFLGWTALIALIFLISRSFESHSSPGAGTDSVRRGTDV